MATDLENFKATMAFRQPDRILYHGSFVADLHRRVIEHIGTEDIAGHYGFGQSSHVGLRRPEGLPALNHSRYWENEELPEGTNINGIGVAVVPAGFYHFFGYISPLRNATSLKEIEEYPMEDLSQWDDSHMAAAVEEAHAGGRYVIAGIGHIYENAWQIRGYEEFLIDTIERPAWAEAMLDHLARQNMIKCTAAARAGADCLHCGDDVANQGALMFSKDTWKKLMLSRWAKIWAASREIKPDIHIFYHSDGNIMSIVEELVDAGVDILNPLQPECLDIDEVVRRVGDRAALDGTIGTQSTMPWGSPDDVRRRVKEVIDKYGRNGGLFIAPTHVLEPEVPLENIDALFEACQEYGTFA